MFSNSQYLEKAQWCVCSKYCEYRNIMLEWNLQKMMTDWKTCLMLDHIHLVPMNMKQFSVWASGSLRARPLKHTYFIKFYHYIVELLCPCPYKAICAFDFYAVIIFSLETFLGKAWRGNKFRMIQRQRQYRNRQGTSCWPKSSSSFWGVSRRWERTARSLSSIPTPQCAPWLLMAKKQPLVQVGTFNLI